MKPRHETNPLRQRAQADGGGAKAPLSNKQNFHHMKGPAAALPVSNAGKIGKKR